MSTIPGLFVLGEANFSDHGANRLGASALMQGLGDGYFIIPYTIGDYLAKANLGKITTDAPEFQETIQQSEDFVKKLLAIKGEKTATSFHRELGLILWDYVGMSRTESGLKEALSRISQLREDFWKNLRVSGEAKTLNKQLELAGRVADFLELGQLMTRDALERKESCGGHFREEYQTPDGEAQRDDDNFRHVAAWQYQGEGKDAIFHKETLNFENVSLTQRSYQ
jgi:succinate dehydrogenase / fumarate reductase flavoprotein subunit